MACTLEGALQGRERQAYWEEEVEEAGEPGEAAEGTGEAAEGTGEAAEGSGADEVEGTGSLAGAGLSTFLKYCPRLGWKDSFLFSSQISL